MTLIKVIVSLTRHKDEFRYAVELIYLEAFRKEFL